jgi:hypothetical protein
MSRSDPQTTQRLRLNLGDSGGRPGARIVVIHGENLGAQIEIGDQTVVVGRSVSSIAGSPSSAKPTCSRTSVRPTRRS